MHTIENEVLSIKIKSAGAELCSIVDKRDQIEHLWQADPAYWAWHAPMLFPIIGVSENDELRIDAKTYPLQKHGFARKSNFELVELKNESAIFSLKYSAETLVSYPYKFDLQVMYQLKENTLNISYSVINLDNKSIYFSIGGHPAIALAYNENETIEDYYIEFEKAETLNRHHINKADGMFNGEQSRILTNSSIIPITSQMFEKDAYIFKDHISRSLMIKSKKHQKMIKVAFEDFNYLGLWAIPGAKYVCVEPWLGCADTKGQFIDYQKKEGIISLETKKTFTCTYSIQII